MCDGAKCPIVAECPLVQSVRKTRFFPLQNVRVAKWSVFLSNFLECCKVSEKRDICRCKMSALQNGRCKMVIFYQIFSNVAKCVKNARGGGEYV